MAAAALLAGVLFTAVALPARASVPRGSQPVFRIADDRITEASGIAAGHASPRVVYVQNDSGDTNRFFALDAATGATAAVVTVTGARNVDWEDIATGPDEDGKPAVWLADIGDNAAGRREVQVYRVAEPRLAPGARNQSIPTAPAEVWRLRYPSGPVDAESFAVAPDGSGYVFTKSPGVSTVYRLPPRPDPGRVQTLRRVGQVALPITGTANPFGVAGQLTATGASISADGRLLVVRTYADAYVWRLVGGDVGAAVRRAPTRIALPRQPQGEGICVQGQRLLLSSEGEHSPVLAVAVPATAAPAAVTAAATSPPTPPASPPRAPASSTAASPPASTPDHSTDGTSRWVAALFVAAAAAAALAARQLRRRRRR